MPPSLSTTKAVGTASQVRRGKSGPDGRRTRTLRASTSPRDDVLILVLLLQQVADGPNPLESELAGDRHGEPFHRGQLAGEPRNHPGLFLRIDFEVGFLPAEIGLDLLQ